MTGLVWISSSVVRPHPKPPRGHELTIELIPKRSPRKPPWKSFIWDSSSLFLEFVGFMFLVLCCFIYYLFALCYCWFIPCQHVTCLLIRHWRIHLIVTESWVRNSWWLMNFNILSTSHMTFQHMVILVIPETNYSQYERTTTQFFFQSWIISKTVDLTNLWSSTIGERN